MNDQAARVIPLHLASPAGSTVVERARATALKIYEQKRLGTDEPAFQHAQAIAGRLTELRLDDDAIAAGWLFAVPAIEADWRDLIGVFGIHVNMACRT